MGTITHAYSYIRFSSEKQKEGDSLRRQTEASERYAKENGLILDTSLNMQDLGVSAYRGSHRTKGNLGAFLKLVETGKIEKGSVLIVENFDRLSRQDNSEALTMFLGIVRAGIKLVTLTDGREYTNESINENIGDLYQTIGEINRAHKESERKSQLLSAAWANKRKQATNGGHILTARCPLWLRLSDDRKKFVLIPEPRQAIEKIYRMRLDGKGKGQIVKELNKNPDIWKPEKSKRNKTGGWQEPYVEKILSDPMVIGTYQPRKRDNESKKAIAGDPILNYYPAAITETLYYQVKALKQQNKIGKSTGGGQTGQAQNLFVHLILCGHCGHPMHFINHGSGQYTYLRCDVARRNLDCTSKGVRYDELERIIFENLEELNISDLMPNENETMIRLNEINHQITANEQRIKELDSNIENLSNAIEETTDKRVRETLLNRQTKAFDQQEQFKKDNEALTEERKTASIEANQIKATLNNANEVYQLIRDTKEQQDVINLRLRLRIELRKIIKSIEVYTLQEPYKAVTQVEDDVYQFMDSRSIDRIRIRFNGSRKKRLILLKTFAEVV
jgi:hypothetical protein